MYHRRKGRGVFAVAQQHASEASLVRFACGGAGKHLKAVQLWLPHHCLGPSPRPDRLRRSSPALSLLLLLPLAFVKALVAANQGDHDTLRHDRLHNRSGVWVQVLFDRGRSSASARCFVYIEHAQLGIFKAGKEVATDAVDSVGTPRKVHAKQRLFPSRCGGDGRRPCRMPLQRVNQVSHQGTGLAVPNADDTEVVTGDNKGVVDVQRRHHDLHVSRRISRQLQLLPLHPCMANCDDGHSVRRARLLRRSRIVPPDLHAHATHKDDRVLVRAAREEGRRLFNRGDMYYQSRSSPATSLLAVDPGN
mmetsp:Transcript_3051/g.10003  ORF Transcript_3051/g.10003 Transcript_3051/m.10003 type:complete len:305 (+) Transcript_3051:1757-2671(+)